MARALLGGQIEAGQFCGHFPGLGQYNRGMEQKQVEALADGPAPEPAPKVNRGRFQPGDRRINREGRPRGRKTVPPEAGPTAERADRLRAVFLSERDLAGRLTSPAVLVATNLPADFEIVSCCWVAGRGAGLIIRSRTFLRIARGTAIPEFAAAFEGPEDLAPADDQLMRLLVPRHELARRLRSWKCWYIRNLPDDYEIVGARVDEGRDAAVLTIRSKTFPWVAKGTLIPELRAAGDGVHWGSRQPY
jgi:hypothetical protein